VNEVHDTVLQRIGIFPPLVWGYVGLLLFMIGDGVEAGFLSPFLVEHGFSEEGAAMAFTAYGLTAAVAAWLSGALSDQWGPRRVMFAGCAIWMIFEVALLLAIAAGGPRMIIACYALRGFGYPLFAFGFLVWITAVSPRARLGAAVGWFWFAFTGGLPTLGSLLASYTVPRIGAYSTLWISLALVLIGGLIALAGVREPIGRRRLAPPHENPLHALFNSLTIALKEPKLAIGCIVRVINTVPEFGFLVFLPGYFTKTVGFSLSEWLRLLSLMFASNILWNLLFGVIGDWFGWRRTVALCGCVGSAASALVLYEVPRRFGASFPLAAVGAVFYGATLAGYVPLSALMPSLTPKNKGAAMSMLNLGAGASVWVGPALVGLFLPRIGVAGVMWMFAALHLLSGLLTLFLRLPAQEQLVASPPVDLIAETP
jgi:polyol permease family